MNKEILRLAVPNILSNISVPLLGSVDIILMGGLSAIYLGAVGLGAVLFNFIYWNLSFLRMGTTGITAQAFGAKDDELILKTLVRSVIVGLILAFVMLIFQAWIFDFSVVLLQVSEEMLPIMKEYFLIRIWAAPAAIGLYAMMGWFFGMQNTLFPLYITLAVNVTNIAISYYLIKVLGWDIDGVALGTTIAQYVGLLTAVSLWLWKYRDRWVQEYLEGVMRWKAILRFLKVNRDIFLRTVALTLTFTFFYSQSSIFGVTLLAVNTILLQLFNWMAYGIDGFAYASESLVGKYIGAKDSGKVRKAISLSFYWGYGFAFVYVLVFGLFYEQLVELFVDDISVIQASTDYYWWVVFLPLVSAASFIWDGVFVGMTASVAMRNTMVIATALFLGVYYLFGVQYFNQGLWASFYFYFIARGIGQYLLFKRDGLELK